MGECDRRHRNLNQTRRFVWWLLPSVVGSVLFVTISKKEGKRNYPRMNPSIHLHPSIRRRRHP